MEGRNWGSFVAHVTKWHLNPSPMDVYLPPSLPTHPSILCRSGWRENTTSTSSSRPRPWCTRQVLCLRWLNAWVDGCACVGDFCFWIALTPVFHHRIQPNHTPKQQQVTTTKGEELLVDSPAKLPPTSERENIMEPYVKVEMLAPTTYTVSRACM